jgi:hypothetical protein
LTLALGLTTRSLSGEITRTPRAAATPFLRAAFRRRILEIRQQNEQTIDRHTIDDVLYAGFDAAAVEKARRKVQDFRTWIAARATTTYRVDKDSNRRPFRSVRRWSDIASRMEPPV